MKIRHIKFVWGGTGVIKARWYFRLVGFYGHTVGAHDDGLAINLRMLLPGVFGVAVAAWLLGAAALFRVWERSPYNLLTYSDALFFPLRPEALRTKRGEALIAQGMEAWHAQRWSEAVACLRLGLAQQPRDGRARLALAQFYLAANQRPAALRLLQEGLTDRFPGRVRLAFLFAAAEQAEDFGVVVRTAARYRSTLLGDDSWADRRWLEAREFAARMGAQQFADALMLAESEAPDDQTGEQRVLALLELHRPDEALQVLAEWRARPEADGKVVTRLSVRAFREARRFDDMERAWAGLCEQTPADPRAYVYGIVQQTLAGREVQARAALEHYLVRFGNAPRNLQLLAEPLAEVADLSLLERCVAAASGRGCAMQPFQALLVQARVKRGEWEGAARTLAEMQALTRRITVEEQGWRDWTRRLLDAVLKPSEATSLTLENFLCSRPWPASMYRTSVESLRRAQQLEAAHAVLGRMRAAFPASGWAEQAEIAVRREMAARSPAPAGLMAVKRGLPAPMIFFARLDEAMRGEEWAAADQLIREVRNARPEPEWLNSRDGELRLAELRLADALGERPRMIAAAALFLNGDAKRSRQVLELGRTCYARGDGDSAIALANAVLRRSPNLEEARNLISEWRHPARPGTP